MKKIVLLLTTIMIVSVLNGCNLSNNETKDVKNKEEISYSNDKNKKETNTASETVKKFEEKSIALNEEDKRILSMLIGETCDFKMSKAQRAVSKNENIIPATDEEKLRLLWIMFCDGWLKPVIDFNNYKSDNSYCKITIPEKDVNKMLKDAFDSKDITIKDKENGLRYVNGNYELSLGNRGDEYIVTDITKITQISETQVKIEGNTKNFGSSSNGSDYVIGYSENFQAIANINADSMFAGYTLISLKFVDSSEEDNDYILPDSDKKYLSAEDIKNLSKDELAIARNEIFARHGYVFKMEEYKNYFKSKTWYKENPLFSVSESELNEYEKANINLIKSYESNKINVTEDGEINYLKYGNARFGFSIDYPDFLTESTESMNGDGVTLTNLENTVCLKAYGLNNVLSQTTKDYFESNKESIGVDISYEALFDNSYILSWEENNLIYYQYTVVGTECFNAFCISYPKEEKEKFDEIVSTIYNSFETGDLTEVHGPIMTDN